MDAAGIDRLRYWRDRLREVIESAETTDGQTAIEFIQAAAHTLGRDLATPSGSADTLAHLVIAEVFRVFTQLISDALTHEDFSRADAQAALIEELDAVCHEVEHWLTNGLPAQDAVRWRLDQVKSEIVDIGATAPRISAEERQKRGLYVDFDQLLEAQRPDTRMAIFQIARAISPELFAFMLNTPSRNVLDNIPTETQREVIQELLQTLQSIPGYPYEISKDAILNELLRYDENLATTKATHLHVKCGGAKPRVEDDGSLLAALQIVAMDLIGTRIYGEMMGVLAFHPLHLALIDRIYSENEPIAALFKNAPDANTNLTPAERELRRMYLSNVIAHWSDGSGGSIDIRHIPEHIILASRLTGDTTSGILQQLCESVSVTLELARALANGETVRTTANVGLGNVTLADEVHGITLPGAHVRRPSPFENKLSPFSEQPTIVLDVDTDLRLLDVVAQGFVPTEDRLEALRNFAAEAERLKVHNAERRQIGEAIRDCIMHVRFAMALASPADTMIGPYWLFTTFRNPLTGWGGNSHRGSGWPATTFPVARIDQEIALTIESIAASSVELDQSLHVGRRRILQAISERSDPIDAFIDFVIAWESLVGSQDNTAYIVAGAMSLLLSPDDSEKRKELFTQIKKLYGFRSNLVHGSVGHDVETKRFKIADVPRYAKQSGRLALDAFKAVLDRPDLTTLNSEERARMILVGFTLR